MDTEMEGMLHLKVLHSPHAHARIVSIDKTAALAVPGVHRVYTWEDVPRKRYSTAIHTDHLVDPDDTYILDNVVRFAGQRVVAVLADTVGAAEEGCRQVEVDLRGAARGLRSRGGDGATAPPSCTATTTRSPTTRTTTSCSSCTARSAIVAAGFAEADVIHEGTYYSPRVQHAHLETHGTIAWMEDGRLHVRTSSQSPSVCKLKLSHLFSLRPDQLRVFCKRVGGGFGGKQELISEDLPVLATLDTGRPVCWEYTREEEFTTASPRHPMKITVKLGAKADGTLTAFALPQRVQHRRLRQPRRRDALRGRRRDDAIPLPQQEIRRLLGVHEHRAQRRAARLRHDAAQLRRRVRDDRARDRARHRSDGAATPQRDPPW